MTFQNTKKSVKYIATVTLAAIILVAFSGTPAFATTTNLPPYSTWTSYNGGGTNDYANATPSSGNEYVYAQNDPINNLPGDQDVILLSSGISLASGHTITLSGTSATIAGTLYVDPVGGTTAYIKVLSYVSTLSNCGSQASGNIILLNKQITSSSWSTSQSYSSSGTTSYTNSGGSAQTVYVCAYAESDSSGGYSYSDFGSSGSSNGITDYKVTATY